MTWRQVGPILVRRLRALFARGKRDEAASDSAEPQTNVPATVARPVPAPIVTTESPVMAAESGHRQDDALTTLSSASSLLSRLRDPRAVRDAIVLKEILDRPVSLRRRQR